MLFFLIHHGSYSNGIRYQSAVGRLGLGGGRYGDGMRHLHVFVSGAAPDRLRVKYWAWDEPHEREQEVELTSPVVGYKNGERIGIYRAGGRQFASGFFAYTSKHVWYAFSTIDGQNFRTALSQHDLVALEQQLLQLAIEEDFHRFTGITSAEVQSLSPQGLPAVSTRWRVGIDRTQVLWSGFVINIITACSALFVLFRIGCW